MPTLDCIAAKIDTFMNRYEADQQLARECRAEYNKRFNDLDDRLAHIEQRDIEHAGAEKLANKVGKIVIAVVSLIGVGVAIVTNYEHWK